MKILQYTDDHSGTCLRDVLEELTGKYVVVNIGNENSLRGVLETWNGIVIKLTNANTSSSVSSNTYIKFEAICAITCSEETP